MNKHVKNKIYKNDVRVLPFTFKTFFFPFFTPLLLSKKEKLHIFFNIKIQLNNEKYVNKK